MEWLAESWCWILVGILCAGAPLFDRGAVLGVRLAALIVPLGMVRGALLIDFGGSAQTDQGVLWKISGHFLAVGVRVREQRH